MAIGLLVFAAVGVLGLHVDLLGVRPLLWKCSRIIIARRILADSNSRRPRRRYAVSPPAGGEALKSGRGGEVAGIAVPDTGRLVREPEKAGGECFPAPGWDVAGGDGPGAGLPGKDHLPHIAEGEGLRTRMIPLAGGDGCLGVVSASWPAGPESGEDGLLLLNSMFSQISNREVEFTTRR